MNFNVSENILHEEEKTAADHQAIEAAGTTTSDKEIGDEVFDEITGIEDILIETVGSSKPDAAPSLKRFKDSRMKK